MNATSPSFAAAVRSKGASVLVVALLLIGFLAGGALAPTLHRVQHAQEYAAAQEAVPHCTHAAHDAPVAERGGPEVVLEECWVLAHNVLSTTLVPAQGIAPAQYESEQSAIVLALHASSVEGQSVIRGPPAGLRA